MKSAKMLTILVVALGLIICQTQLCGVSPVDTAFTHRGQLPDANSIVDGYYDFEFKLFDDPNVIFGYQVGSDVNIADVEVVDGYFSVELDFNDPCMFAGNARWLEIGVRLLDEFSDPDEYTTLEPRYEVLATGNVLLSEGAGANITEGNDNSAVGYYALYSDTTGNDNSAMGHSALYSNTTGSYNSAMGMYALMNSTTGNYNSAMGNQAGYSNSTGTGNVFLGYEAGYYETGSEKLYIANGRYDNDVLIYGEFDTGNVGIGTTGPTDKLHISSGEMRVQMADQTSGDYSQSLGIEWSQETDLTVGYIRAVRTAWSGAPHRLDFATRNESSVIDVGMTIDPDGNVGIGTTEPANQLHVYATSGNTWVKAESTALDSSAGFILKNDAVQWNIAAWGTGGDAFKIREAGVADRLVIKKTTGNVGIGTTSPTGKLDVNGSIYQRGSVLHADYVFEPDYELESIDEHSEFMWQKRHLPAIPKAEVDDAGQQIVEVGAHRRGIVEELEKAHIYIEQLHNHINELKGQNEKIESRLAAMETAVASLTRLQEGDI